MFTYSYLYTFTESNWPRETEREREREREESKYRNNISSFPSTQGTYQEKQNITIPIT
jgi:hypothetical protein